MHDDPASIMMQNRHHDLSLFQVSSWVARARRARRAAGLGLCYWASLPVSLRLASAGNWGRDRRPGTREAFPSDPDRTPSRRVGPARVTSGRSGCPLPVARALTRNLSDLASMSYQ
jgi:hypothetical protein